MKQIIIEKLEIMSHEVIESLNSLLLQLNKNAKLLTKDNIKEILDSPKDYLFVAKDSNTNTIVGMLILITYRIPFAKKGIIEDLVVDEKWRGKGIGRRLINYAVRQAHKKLVQYIDLTSNPTRENGNKLYQCVGFKKRNTNVYRMEL